MSASEHLGSLRPVPARRLLAFLGLSVAVHVVVLVATSLGYLLAPAEDAKPGDSQTPASTAAPAASASATPTPAAALPEAPAPAKSATDAYLDRQPTPDPTKAKQAVDGLDAFE